MLLYHKVKPILVFDGGHLPSKSEKEAERRMYVCIFNSIKIAIGTKQLNK